MGVFVVAPSFAENCGTWFQTQQGLLCEVISKSMSNVFLTHITTRIVLWFIIMQLDRERRRINLRLRYCYTWLCSHSPLSWGEMGNNGVLGLLRALQLINSRSPVCSQSMKAQGSVPTQKRRPNQLTIWVMNIIPKAKCVKCLWISALEAVQAVESIKAL